MFFGIPAWVLAVVLVGVEVLQYVSDRVPELIVLLFTTIGATVWSVRSFGLLSNLQWLPRINLGKRTPKPVKRKFSGPVVVDGGWPTTQTYAPMHD